MAKTIQINIKADTSQTVKSINDLENAIASMEDQLKSEQLGSKEFKRLQGEIGKARNEMEKIEQSSAKFSDKSVAMGDNIEKLGAGIAGAFSVATGVVGAFGDSLGFSAEDIANAQQKAMSFIAIMQGLKPVLEGVKAAQALLNVVMAANPIGLIVVAVGALIAAFIAFREPIIEFLSNWENLRLILLAMLGPIGWIIIAYEKLFSEEAKLEDAREKATAENTARTNKRISEIKAEQQAFVTSVEAQNAILEKKITIMENEGKSSFEVRKQILENNAAVAQSHIDSVKKIIEAKTQQYKVEAQLRGQTEEEFIQHMKSIGVDLIDLQKRSNELLDGLQLDLQVAESEITALVREENQKRADAYKDRLAKEKEAAEAAYKAEQDRLRNLRELYYEYLADVEAAETSYYDKKLSAREKDLQDVNDYYFDLIERGKQYGEDTTQLEQMRIDDIREINSKYDQEEAEALKAKKERDKQEFKQFIADLEAKEKEKIDKIVNYINIASQALIDGLTAIDGLLDQRDDQRAYEREKKFSEEEEALKASLANREMSQKEYDNKLILMKQQQDQADLAEKRKSFRRDKSFNLAKAIISTSQAIAQALASSIPPLNFINAGITGALGGVQIATIASSKFQAAKGGVVPGSGPGHIDSVPSLLAPGEMVINSNSAKMFPQLLSALNQAGGGISLAPDIPITGGNSSVYRENQQVVKAYVVEQEITDKQKKADRMRRSAQFG